MLPIPEVSELDIAFPTRALEILPPYEKIPKEFKEKYNRWVKVVEDWFFSGLTDCKWTPKPGVETSKALAAVAACLGDWSPKQEHKTAGCAYLLSEWFDDVTYKIRKK